MDSVTELGPGRRRALYLMTGTSALFGPAWLRAQPKDVTLRISYYPIAAEAAQILGEQRGFFAAEGIALEKDSIRLPADGIANLLGGKLDITTTNIGGLALAAYQRLPLRIGPSIYFSEGGDQGIYVRAESPIRTVADLQGKTISLVQFRNNFHAGVLEHLEAAGVDISSVKFTLIPVTNSAAALRAGTVDAAHLVEPFIAMAGDSIRPVIYNAFDLLPGRRAIVGYWITSEKFAKESSDVLARFIRAMSRSNDLAGSDPALARKAVAGITEISPEVLARMKMPIFSSDRGKKSASEQLDKMVKYKMVPTRPDIEPMYL